MTGKTHNRVDLKTVKIGSFVISIDFLRRAEYTKLVFERILLKEIIKKNIGPYSN